MALFSSALPVDHNKIVTTIAEVEAQTSGEIRVLVARGKADDPVTVARGHFERLGMTRTSARNGVLIFVAPTSRTFAIIGDTGIHERCGPIFWEEVAAAMEQRFKAGDFTAGLVEGIRRAGSLLQQHFPRRPDDRNELPDTVEEV
jgi:uncharacterized membrane protein